MESVSLFNLPVHRPLGPDPLIRSFVRHLYAEFARLGPSWSGGASEVHWGMAKAAVGDTAPRVPLPLTTSRSARPLRPGHIAPAQARK
jgi:hypothetical protein